MIRGIGGLSWLGCTRRGRAERGYRDAPFVVGSLATSAEGGVQEARSRWLARRP
jgi:hypothetical protein